MACKTAAGFGQISPDCWCFWTTNQKVFYICRRLKIQHSFEMKKIVRNEIMVTVGVTFLIVLVLLLFV